MAGDTQHQQRSSMNLMPTLQQIQSDSVCEINEKPSDLRVIEDMHTFLEKSLKKHVLNYTLSRITKPGDNYNFLLQGIEVKLLQNDSFDVNNLFNCDSIS